jgi:hypothetical protein
MNGDLGVTWKKAILDCFTVLSQHVHGGTGKSSKILS